MATERLLYHVIDNSAEEARREALAASLYAAVEALSACVEAMYTVLEHVEAPPTEVAELPESTHHPAPVRPRVSYGGGRSTLVPVPASRLLATAGPEATAGREATPGQPGQPEQAGGPGPQNLPAAETGPADRGAEPLVRQPQDPHPGVSALMAAADMAHEGYSTDEIAERLRLRWGDRAASVLRDLLD